MIIREAIEGDIPAISDVARRTYAETFGDGLTTEQLTSVLKSTRSETYFKTAMDRGMILVALDNSQLVGYIQISDVGYRVEGVDVSECDQAIHSIYVDSDHQGRGVGRALMDAAFKHPRIREAEKVFIDVYEENTRALEFYKRYGFKSVGKVDVVIDGQVIGYDLVLMRHSV